MGVAASSGVDGDAVPGVDQKEPLQQQQQQQQLHFVLGREAAAADSPVAPAGAARNLPAAYHNPSAPTAAVSATAAASSAAAAAADAGGVVGLSSVFFPPPQKGLRTIDVQSLFRLPKLALASAVWPDETSSSGPLAAAEKVLLQQQQQGGLLDPIPASAAQFSRYKKLLLRDRLSSLEKKEEKEMRRAQEGGLRTTAAVTEGQNANRDDWAVRKPEEEEFDFVSLSGLAMRETGIFPDPSLGSLSRCVGFYSTLNKLKLQLQKQLHQTERKMELKAQSSKGDNTCDGKSGDSSSSRRGETKTEEGARTAKGACFEGRSGHGQRTPSKQELEQQQQGETRQQQEDGSACARIDGAFVPVCSSPTDVADAPFAASVAVHQELLQLQCLCMQLQEDIQILHRACGELHALLQGVWQAAKMPLNHKINKIEFRELWCCGADNDEQQVQLADKIFELCSQGARGLERHTPSNSSNTNSSSNSICRCGCGAGGSERLAFADLLYQVPPKALECMWCRAELRRQKKQQYRYFWI